MNTHKRSTRFIPATPIREGAGVLVHRTIGTPAIRQLDPFIMLDHFSSDDPDEYIAGFPSHPHRGFNTFTYMIDGHMEHKDSMGNTGHLSPGSAQWMKAGSGVIHSEMPQQENGLMRGFQLWINLPAANKMESPEYQEYGADEFPMVETAEHQVKVLIGSYEMTQSPIKDSITEASYFDVQVTAGKEFRYPLPEDHQSFFYLFEGEGLFHGKPVKRHTLIAVGTEDSNIEFMAGKQGARFILVSGKPIDEPIVQYGPFVMNTREEIEQALRDYQSDDFVKTKAWVNRQKKT